MEPKEFFRLVANGGGWNLEVLADGEYILVDTAPNFQKNEDSAILAMRNGQGLFDLFGIAGSQIYSGPRGCYCYYDTLGYFVYRQSTENIYFEEPFDRSEKVLLGQRRGNIFIHSDGCSELMSYYDEAGCRHSCRYLGSERYIDSIAFLREDGYYDIYNPQDFVYREVFRMTGMDFVPAVSPRSDRRYYSWDNKRKAYKRRE